MCTLKKTYSCRHVSEYQLLSAIPADYCPEAGDVGIFEIVSIGKHRSVQSCSKRNVSIGEGDHIMASIGEGYKTERFKGCVPNHVNQELHILGASCTVGLWQNNDEVKSPRPTTVLLIGLAADAKGMILNIKKIMQHKMFALTDNANDLANVFKMYDTSISGGKVITAAYVLQKINEASSYIY